MNDNDVRSWSWPAKILAGLLVALAILFLPLAFVAVERTMSADTSYVADAMKWLGVYEFFDTVYSAVDQLLRLK